MAGSESLVKDVAAGEADAMGQQNSFGVRGAQPRSARLVGTDMSPGLCTVGPQPVSRIPPVDAQPSVGEPSSEGLSGSVRGLVDFTGGIVEASSTIGQAGSASGGSGGSHAGKSVASTLQQQLRELLCEVRSSRQFTNPSAPVGSGEESSGCSPHIDAGEVVASDGAATDVSPRALVAEPLTSPRQSSGKPSGLALPPTALPTALLRGFDELQTSVRSLEMRVHSLGAEFSAMVSRLTSLEAVKHVASKRLSEMRSAGCGDILNGEDVMLGDDSPIVPRQNNRGTQEERLQELMRNDDATMIKELKDERMQVATMLDNIQAEKYEVVAVMHSFQMNKDLAFKELKEYCQSACETVSTLAQTNSQARGRKNSYTDQVSHGLGQPASPIRTAVIPGMSRSGSYGGAGDFGAGVQSTAGVGSISLAAVQKRTSEQRQHDQQQQ
eukprot:TRINITY_DN19697_c0_g2_i2.p1 TRINITY_DN19697_c0_g2~~TRINITY_DN19697_c0_g2_i2.p1  ORF type:complete len:440 (+),score=93.00 TRINITY_DN19697_c0_g2_i2:104-1423(+)